MQDPGKTADSGSSEPQPANSSAAEGGRLSIGALSRATGIPVETLRTWEARYGFPEPERRPSGHRVYPAAIVTRLRRIAEALARGHRACEAVRATESQLSALLDVTPCTALPQVRPPAVSDPGLAQLMEAVARFDADSLTRTLLTDAARLGIVEFIEGRVAPLVQQVGSAWSEGTLQIRHEHFLSERLGDLLRTLRLPYEDRARGPLVIFATPPGEAHGIGLQMAALAVASAGCRVLYLGTEVPTGEAAELASDISARAVALSVSVYSAGEASRGHIEDLRVQLPRRIELVVGGGGAPAGVAGVRVFTDVRGLHDWAQRLVA